MSVSAEMDIIFEEYALIDVVEITICLREKIISFADFSLLQIANIILTGARLMGNVAALFHSGSRHVGAGSGGLNIGYIQWTRFAAMTYQALPNTHS
ncbi:hypothetical protein FNE85_19005 [Escherichia coli]|nr:hypothetical protein FNE85_19005 [Escherichia coli]HDI8426853.1 hypothetical protein [Escherichia coli]